MSEGGDKTEEPSQKKLDDARKEGNVWKSKDLSGVIAFAVSMSVVRSNWPTFETRIKELFYFAIDHIAHPEDITLATQQLLYLSLTALLGLCIPIAFSAAVAGSIMEFLQVGALLALNAVMPKFDKLNPINGLKNLVGKKQIIELVKSMAKLGVSGYVVYGVVRDSMNIVVATIHGDAAITMTVMGELVYRVCQKVVLLFLIFAIFDVWWQQKSYMKDQMMSKEDQKKEYKESEGDPHHKAKRKELAHELLESAQMDSVKGADVVVTNPDHVAIALKYDRSKDNAPRLIAKGIEGKASSIRELAKQYDVPMLRNVPLAHALLRIDVNEEVPEDLYDAVAEVLNFVYQLKQAQDQRAPAA
ncbi:MAG: EscU/YscU/HrcU family type III secretion system export apparatus switch protein [Archangium sp.]|nr:EscU/YscU/HrcU family type III secretion system export apparatus switch protein [Archangium sp.]